jgi:hypothetical protein
VVSGYYPKVSNSVLHNVAIKMNSNLSYFSSHKSLHGHCCLLFPNTLAGVWAGGAGSGRYFLPPNKFSVRCALCHIAPTCHLLLCFVSKFFL